MKLDEVFPEDIDLALDEAGALDRLRRGLTTAAAVGGIGLGTLAGPAIAKQPPHAVATQSSAIDELGPRKGRFIDKFSNIFKKINADLIQQRVRLKHILEQRSRKIKISADDSRWLDQKIDQYNADDEQDLLIRLAPVPISMALAQGAVESRWGLDEIARKGNSYFGQRGWKRRGTIPGPKGERYSGFASPADSARAYAMNLNTHEAYASFRTMRARMLDAGQALDGVRLSTGLSHYSTRGQAYVHQIQNMITSNQLARYDTTPQGNGR